MKKQKTRRHISNKKRTNKKNNRGKTKKKENKCQTPPQKKVLDHKVDPAVLWSRVAVWGSVGSFSLVFPGLARFHHVAHFRSFRLSFDKFTENSFFLRNRAFLGVTTRKNRYFSGMGGVTWPTFLAHFWIAFFLRSRGPKQAILAKFASFCETRRTAKEPGRSPDFSGEGFRKCFENDPHTARSAGRSVSWAAKEPGLLDGCEGALPYVPCFFGSLAALARGSLAALHLLLSAVGSVFPKLRGSLPAEKVSKFGPPRAPTGYIYIYRADTEPQFWTFEEWKGALLFCKNSLPTAVRGQNRTVSKRHLSRRHLSVLNFLFDFIFDGGCTCEKEIRFH